MDEPQPLNEELATLKNRVKRLERQISVWRRLARSFRDDKREMEEAFVAFLFDWKEFLQKIGDYRLRASATRALINSLMEIMPIEENELRRIMTFKDGWIEHKRLQQKQQRLEEIFRRIDEKHCQSPEKK